MHLSVILNGQNRDFPTLSPPAKLQQLIDLLGLKADRVAIECNGEIVPRRAWPETMIKTGDRLELVHFVGGGKGSEPPLGVCPVSR